MKKFYLMSLVALAAMLLVPLAWGNGTAAGTVITQGTGTSQWGDPVIEGQCYSNFQSGAGQYNSAAASVYTTIDAVYGWAIATDPNNGASGGQPGVAWVAFTWVVVNRGNASDHALIDSQNISYTGPGTPSNWTIAYYTSEGAVTTTKVAAEDAATSFWVSITPSSTVGQADDGSKISFDVRLRSAGNAAHTRYIGDDTTTNYCGLAADFAKGGTITDDCWLTITGPVISTASAVTMITTPGNGAAGDVVPGSSIVYRVRMTNSGLGSATGAIIYNQIANQTKLHYGSGATGTLLGSTGTTQAYYDDGSPAWDAFSTVYAAGRAAVEGCTKVRLDIGSLAASAHADLSIRVVVK